MSRTRGWLAPDVAARLAGTARDWLVTGGAGFIGSNLVETLLAHGQSVTALDNFATGTRANIDQAVAGADGDAAARFTLIDGDIRDRDACAAVVAARPIVLHQAALGSVPRSLNDPLASHDTNVTGFLNMIDAARRAGVNRFIYAASSSTYGDHPALPKVEDRIGKPLSPYAATKVMDELYAHVFGLSYGFAATGLRYFNVFGPRQNPEGPYAAVIPTWTRAMIEGRAVTINGDGETSRDFCYIANAVEANIRAALADDGAQGEVYNVALGDRTTLNQLFGWIRDGLGAIGVAYDQPARYADFRPGDVRHSQADIGKARVAYGYDPQWRVPRGLAEALPYYVERFSGGVGG